MRVVALALVAALSAFFVLGASSARARLDDPKYTIKDVMNKAHKGDSSLLKKVINGSASDDEKKQLVEYYTALSQSMPPKGDADAWTMRTKDLLNAAKSNDIDALKKASNCGSCHKAFKK